MIRHGKWGAVFSAPGLVCDNRAVPGYCEAAGAHLGMRCGIRHDGLEERETCAAVLVSCQLHPGKIRRDRDQEDRIERRGRRIRRARRRSAMVWLSS